MKKITFLFAVLQFIAFNNQIKAQNIGINATGAAPAASAGLDVDFTNKGLLVPRVALTALNAAGPIAAPAVSLLVYNTATAGAAPNNVTPGYYYWGGVAWIAIGGSGGLDWSLTGNAGTNIATNFIGTTDNNSVAFRSNNIERMRILNDGRVAVNSVAPFGVSTFYSQATGNNDAVDGDASGTGDAVYGQNAGTGSGVTGLSTNGNGLALGGFNIAAAAAGIGFGGFFSNRQTGGATIVSDLGGTFTFFPNSAISAFASTTGGSKAILAANNTVNSVVIQAQSTSTTTTGVLSITNSLTRGNSSIIGQVTTPSLNGTAYSDAGTTTAVKGRIAGFRTYSFGLLGITTSTANRTGGVIGLSPFVGTWSALGYRNSVGTVYSLYFTAAGTGSGTGRYTQGGETNEDATNIGMGGYGDLMGQWVRGNVYGMNIKGNRYGLYVDGKTYTNNVIAQLSESKNGQKREVAYVSTGINVDVLDRGIGQLANGKVFIPFTSTFKNLASKEYPAMVTVTPNGASNGLYIESVTKEGFTVIENNNGTSNTKFTWIAITTRVGYENPETPEELLSKEYDANMEGVMFNENNIDNTATNMLWDGFSLHFSKTPLINKGELQEMNKYEYKEAKTYKPSKYPFTQIKN